MVSQPWKHAENTGGRSTPAAHTAMNKTPAVPLGNRSAAVSAETTPHTPHILIVDDDGPLLAELVRILTAQKYLVTCAGSAETGVEAARAQDFDFVFLDYRLPGKNGSWFMRHASLADNTKVLLLTAFANRQLIDEIMKLGASGYLVKPIDEDELFIHLAFHSSGRSHRTHAEKEKST